MNFKSFFLLALTFGAVTVFQSCDKDEPSRKDSDLSLAFEYNYNGQAFNYDQVYDVNGTKVSFQAVQFYVGGIEMEPETGDAVQFAGKYLLVKPTSGAQAVGTLDKKHYHKINFFTGVSAEDNSQTTADFDSRKADDPLARQTDLPMHWNWNSGYIFVRIDGKVDLDGDNVPETNLQYHLGTNNFRRDMTITLHNDIDADAETLTFSFDVAKLFTSLDVSQHYSMHTGDDPTSALTFANNIATAIALK